MRRQQGWAWWTGLAILIGVVGLGASAARAATAGDTPWLGVYTQELTPSLRTGLDFSGDGVLVNRVIPESPADRAGLRKGDIIVGVNSRTPRSPDDLANMVQGGRVGQSVRLEVVRDNERRSLSATLAARPDRDDDQTWTNGRDDDEDHDSEPAPDSDDVPTPRAPGAPRTPDSPRVHVYRFKGTPGEGMSGDMGMPGDVMRMMGRGRLGVRVEALNSDLAEALGASGSKGALVVEVLKDTPAERAGLKAGDVITAVGEQKVYDAGDLIEALGKSDQKVTLTVLRRGARRTVSAELEGGMGSMRMFENGPLGDRVRAQGDDNELRDQVRQLRDEVRQLREQLRDQRHD